MKIESSSTTNTSSSTAPSSSHIAGTCYSLPKYIYDFPSWVIDFGATTHICYSRELFTFIKPITGFNISFPDHPQLSVKIIGTVHISPDLLLVDVLFIPEFWFNLISISALTMKSPYEVQFLDDFYLIQDKCSLRTIGKAKLQQGLFNLHTNSHHRIAISTSYISTNTWHNRLGHPSHKLVNILKDMLHVKTSQDNTPCLVCPLAKQRRLPFQSNNHYMQ